MANGDFKDLKKRTAADKVLRDKAFNIAKSPKCDGYQRGLASTVYKFFDKKTKCSDITLTNKPIPQNEQLTENIINLKKFMKRKVYSAFDIYSKYAWAVPLKDKKGVSIVNLFQSILKKSNRKPNKIWVDKGGEFYNRSMKSWLGKNDIEIHSIHNEGKSVVAERFIRTIKNKVYRHMTSISKIVYIDKLDDIVHKYNNKKHRTIKMKPIDVKDNTYIDFNNDPKLKVGDHVRL